MTYLESQTELCKKLNITYDTVNAGLNGLFTLDDIKGYVLEAHKLVWGYKAWDFTEGDKTFDISAEEVAKGYVDYPEDYMSGSIFFMLVDGIEYYKTVFRDLKKYQSDNPNGDYKVYAERQRFIFFNSNSLSAGQTIDFSGKLKSSALSVDADLMPFSEDTDNEETAGNDLIVKLAYSAALGGEKKKDKAGAKTERDDAYAKLNLLWEQVAGSRTANKPSRPQFDVPDFLSSGFSSDNPIGSFNY